MSGGFAFTIREHGERKVFVFDTKDQGYLFLWHHMDADCLSITPVYSTPDLREYTAQEGHYEPADS